MYSTHTHDELTRHQDTQAPLRINIASTMKIGSPENQPISLRWRGYKTPRALRLTPTH